MQEGSASSGHRMSGACRMLLKTSAQCFLVWNSLGSLSLKPDRSPKLDEAAEGR